jgi:hypothetical protein
MIVMLMLCCVVPYGEPLVSHISVEVSTEERVDFSVLHTELDSQLLRNTDRFDLERLKELERLLIAAKGWGMDAQKDLYRFAEQFLMQSPEHVEESVDEDPQEMDFVLDVVSVEGDSSHEDVGRLKEAKELVAQGKSMDAIALLEECRTLPCWSDVYVYWAECVDKEFALRIADINEKELSLEEELLFWNDLSLQFEHPQHRMRIDKEKERIEALLDSP